MRWLANRAANRRSVMPGLISRRRRKSAAANAAPLRRRRAPERRPFRAARLRRNSGRRAVSGDTLTVELSAPSDHVPAIHRPFSSPPPIPSRRRHSRVRSRRHALALRRRAILFAAALGTVYTVSLVSTLRPDERRYRGARAPNYNRRRSAARRIFTMRGTKLIRRRCGMRRRGEPAAPRPQQCPS